MLIESNISKADFIFNILNRDLANIYKAQRLIVTRNTYMQGKDLKMKKRAGAQIGYKTGALIRSLEHPDYTISGADGKFGITANYPLHIRFLDMKRKGNWMIYNRQVWGILYNNSLRDLRLNYGKEIHDYVEDRLLEAFANK